MNSEKTFAAIKKLQEVEIEMHRLKNALEMANKALAAQRQWVGLTGEERAEIAMEANMFMEAVRATEAKLKEKNT